MNHGTYSEYTHSRCRCEECTRANREYHRKINPIWRARRRDLGIPEEVHGTNNGYISYACRCGHCKHAHTKTAQAYRRRKQEEES